MDLSKLKKEIPYKWKIQAKPKEVKWIRKKWVCVAYIDSRDVQDILDNVCWMENWKDRYYEAKGKLFCEISIKINNERISKSDSWALEENDNVDTETTSKWESSDAFKRAAVKRWIGRFLYWLKTHRIDHIEYEKNKYNLTEFINKKSNVSKTNTDREEDSIFKKVFDESSFENLKKKKDDYVDFLWVKAILCENYDISEERLKKVEDLFSKK